MHWIVFMASLYMYYVPCFVLVEHSVFRETMSVLIKVFILLVLVEHSVGSSTNNA